ncbi:MAG TPA: calcium/sodium antiporter [Polyangiaceae bacterium]|jgi:cation:H+ antiporter|nr:calcium/sodium antiporter [Polyangiaceae bacterium]
MTLHPAVLFLGGLVVVVVGAELLLRGATRLAAMLRIKPILIGLTVVAVGTSAPELAVGVTAVLEGKGALAAGNIAGTNIFNILFILGLSAAIRPLPLQLQSIRLDVPVMIAAAVMLYFMALDGVLSRAEGLVLVGAGLAYTAALIRLSRRESAEMKQEFAEEFSPQALQASGGLAQGSWNALLLLVGICLTVLGADIMVAGAANLARMFGVSDAIIGLTIVAIGTSAPELATTVVATFKDDRDVAIGNLIGSSISNIFVILGLTSVLAPHGVEVSQDVLRFDLPLGAAVAIACWPVFRSDRQVSRGEGLAFVSAYLAYLTILVFVRA